VLQVLREMCCRSKAFFRGRRGWNRMSWFGLFDTYIRYQSSCRKPLETGSFALSRSPDIAHLGYVDMVL
jgi:hypothetical protein